MGLKKKKPVHFLINKCRKKNNFHKASGKYDSDSILFLSSTICFIFIAKPFFKLSGRKIKINEGKKRNTQIHLTITSHGYTHLMSPTDTAIPVYQLVTALWASLKHLSFTFSHSYWFLSTISLLSVKMSYETQIPLLKGDVQHAIWYRGFDNTIIVATFLHVFWQDWWPHDHSSPQWWKTM